MHIDNAEALNSRNRRWPYAGLAAKFSRALLDAIQPPAIPGGWNYGKTYFMFHMARF
jgi:hypothetical protein